MKRDLGDGYELDDDRTRIDRDAVHAYLGGESYWAKGRTRERQDALIEASQHVVGLYKDGRPIGFGLGERARRDALKVITSSYEYHGGFRLRTLSA